MNDDSLHGVAIARRPQADKSIATRGWSFFTSNELFSVKVGKQYEVLCLDLHTYHVVVRSYDPLSQFGVLHFLNWSNHFDYEGNFHCIYIAHKGNYSQQIQAKTNTYPTISGVAILTRPKDAELIRRISTFSDDEDQHYEPLKRRRTAPTLITPTAPTEQENDEDELRSVSEEYEPLKSSTRYDKEWLYKPQRSKRSPRPTGRATQENHNTVNKSSSSVASSIMSSSSSNPTISQLSDVPKIQLKPRIVTTNAAKSNNTDKLLRIDPSSSSFSRAFGGIVDSLRDDSSADLDTSVTPTRTKRTVLTLRKTPPANNPVSNSNKIKLAINVTDLDPVVPTSSEPLASSTTKTTPTPSSKQRKEKAPLPTRTIFPFEAHPEQLHARINEEVRKQNLWRELIQILFREEFPQQALLSVFESIDIRNDILEHLDALMRIKFQTQLTQAIAQSYPKDSKSPLQKNAQSVSPLRLLMPFDTTPQYIENIQQAWTRQASHQEDTMAFLESPQSHIVTPLSSDGNQELKPQHDVLRFVSYMMNVPFQMHLTARLLQDMKDLQRQKSQMASCDHPMVERAQLLLQNLLDSYAAIKNESI